MWSPNVYEKLYLKIQEREFKKLYKAEKAADRESEPKAWSTPIAFFLSKTLQPRSLRRYAANLRKRLQVSFD